LLILFMESPRNLIVDGRVDPGVHTVNTTVAAGPQFARMCVGVATIVGAQG